MTSRISHRSLVALIGAALNLQGCNAAPPPSAEAEHVADVAAMPAADGIYTAVVRRGQVTGAITTSGSIAARRSTTLGPSVPGRIIHIFVQVGDEVPFGAPIFQIDPGPYASIFAEADAGRALARADLEDARENEARIAMLAAKQMISSEDHRRARTAVSLAALRLEAADARSTRARDDLNRTLVLAPYAGSIIERSAHEGTMATVTPNTAVAVLQESGELEAIVDVPEASRIAVRPGDRVRIWTEELPDPLESEVRAVSRAIDPRTRTYRVRASIRDPSSTLKSGAFVRAEISPGPRPATLLVERSATAQRDGTSFVFRVSNGRAERVTVRLGVLGLQDAEVLEGLAEGDVVVLGDVVGRLSDGARVRPLEIAAGVTPEARP
jgi:RND family efflux transporter MFP subunit